MGVRSIHRLVGVLGKTGHLIPRTRPGRFRVLEYASLGLNVWFIVQRAGWNKDLLGITNLPWQGPSALDAECASKALRPWQFVGFYQGAVSRPGECSITDEKIARMTGTRRFSAARAVTMVKTDRLSGYYKLERAAQARSFEGLLGHG